MKIISLTIYSLLFLLTGRHLPKQKFTNSVSDKKMLLVIAAPSVHDNYYTNTFQNIVDFQINYIKQIIGKDNVILLVDDDTKKYYSNQLPTDILLSADINDIWMRDFTTVNPQNPIQFRYTWASMSKKQSVKTQNSFIGFAKQHDLNYQKSSLLLDGGNLVDNYSGKYITTTRFLTDNKLSYEEGKKVLMNVLNAKSVAIIDADEQVLAHADGMVSWIAEDVLLINDYGDNPHFQNTVLNELKRVFPNTKIIEVPVQYQESKSNKYKNFSSACGINLNAVVTLNYIYLPTFNLASDNKIIQIIQKHTSKTVIPVNAQGVCEMGGSVRCLTWQLAGQNAQKLIEAARN